jgi:hypothetical protein
VTFTQEIGTSIISRWACGLYFCPCNGVHVAVSKKYVAIRKDVPRYQLFFFVNLMSKEARKFPKPLGQ